MPPAAARLRSKSVSRRADSFPSAITSALLTFPATVSLREVFLSSY